MLRQTIFAPRVLGFLEKTLRIAGERVGGQLMAEKARATCLLCGLQSDINKRTLHTSLPRSKAEDRKEMLKSLPRKDEGTEGERSVDVDLLSKSSDDLFPDENTPNRLFGGIPFSQLPVCDIKVSRNNTILTLSDHKGVSHMMRSCGMEGFKNARKGTNIAAQATAISLSMRAIDRGYKTIRVRVAGVGPGRMSAIKGLSMGGLDVVSITDSTRVSFHPSHRARKQRRL